MEDVSDAPPPLYLRRVGRPPSIETIGDVFPLHLGTTTLGRSRTTANTPGQSGARHIYLDSVVSKCLISRQHARLLCWKDSDKGIRATVSDMSVNGVFVNDEKIGRPADLRPGDVLTLGHRRGAALIAGTLTTQSNSEFAFKLERWTGCRGDAAGNGAATSTTATSATAIASTPSASLFSASSSSRPMAAVAAQDDDDAARPPDAAASLPASQTTATGSAYDAYAGDSQQSWLSSGSFCFSTGLTPDVFPSAPRSEGSVSSLRSSEIDLSDADSTMVAGDRVSVAAAAGHDSSPERRERLAAAPESPPTPERADMSANDRCAARRDDDAGVSTRCSTRDMASAESGKRKHAEDDGAPRTRRERRAASQGVAVATATLAGRRSQPRPGSSVEYHDAEDCCASVDCRQPGGESLLDWVQCGGGCALWYHVQCMLPMATGLDAIRKSEFRCGCV